MNKKDMLAKLNALHALQSGRVKELQKTENKLGLQRADGHLDVMAELEILKQIWLVENTGNAKPLED